MSDLHEAWNSISGILVTLVILSIAAVFATGVVALINLVIGGM